MTEQEWLTSTDPFAMLLAVESVNGVPFGSRPSNRKLRLFVCACCRSVWHLLTDDSSRLAVEVAEQYADGLATLPEVMKAYYGIRRSRQKLVVAESAYLAVRWAVTVWENYTVERKAREVMSALAHYDLHQEQANLLRDIVGNPFRPLGWRECQRCKGLKPTEHFAELCDCSGRGYIIVPPPQWNSTVLQLAQTVYDGGNCGFALHDALIETGHVNMAEHFAAKEQRCERCGGDGAVTCFRGPGATNPYRPDCSPCGGSGFVAVKEMHLKGCWAIDYILSRE